MLQDEYKRACTHEVISNTNTRATPEITEWSLLKLKNQIERQEQKQIQWYLKCDRQKEQEIEYRYATGHLVHSTAVPEIITAQDQEQPTEPDRVQMICYPWLVDYIERDRAGSHQREPMGQFTHEGESIRIWAYERDIALVLFLIEESKEAAGEKEEASYIGDNVGKHDVNITGLCSRRKHLFYRDNQSSRIISLPERDRKRG